MSNDEPRASVDMENRNILFMVCYFNHRVCPFVDGFNSETTNYIEMFSGSVVMFRLTIFMRLCPMFKGGCRFILSFITASTFSSVSLPSAVSAMPNILS